MREYDPDYCPRFRAWEREQWDADHAEAAAGFDAYRSAYAELRQYLEDEDGIPTEDHPELVREVLDMPYRSRGDSSGYGEWSTWELEDARGEYSRIFDALERAFTLGTKLPQPGYSARMLEILDGTREPELS